MPKLMSLETLIHYSNKLNGHISNIAKEVNTRIDSTVAENLAQHAEIETKISANTNSIAETNKNIQGLETKHDALSQTVAGIKECDGHPDGDIINFNDIEQHVFRNILAGDTIEIPNPNGDTDFIIECYEEVNSSTNYIIDKVIEINSNNPNLTYDSNYVDMSELGAKPKDNVILNYTLQEQIVDPVDSSKDYSIYVSDVIGEDILTRLDDIINIEEI